MASETAQFYAFPTKEALKSVGNQDIPGRLTAPVGWTLPLGQDDLVHFGHIDQAPIIHPAAVQDRASGRPDRYAVSHQTDGSVFSCCTSGTQEHVFRCLVSSAAWSLGQNRRHPALLPPDRECNLGGSAGRDLPGASLEICDSDRTDVILWR